MNRHDQPRHENRSHESVDQFGKIVKLLCHTPVGFVDRPNKIVIKFGGVVARKIERARFFKQLRVQTVLQIFLYDGLQNPPIRMVAQIKHKIIDRHKDDQIHHRQKRRSVAQHIEKYFRIIQLNCVIDTPGNAFHNRTNHIKRRIFARDPKQIDVVPNKHANLDLLFCFFIVCHDTFTPVAM